MKLDYSQQIFLKNTQISNFMKIHPVGAELFHAGRQTAMTKLTVTFWNTVYAPKNTTLVQSEASDTIDFYLAHPNYMTSILDFN